MREYWILTRLQLTSLFGINKIRHMKNEEEKKQGKRALGALIGMTFALCYVSILYSVAMGQAFQMFGMLPSLLGIMAMAASVLVLIFSIFETKGVLFGFGDYDTVMSWPVDVRAVAASRVTSMYAYNFVYAALLLLPAGGVYAVLAAPPLWFYPLSLVLILLLPAVPTIAGAALGTLMTIVTARMKKRNFMSIVLQLVLVLALMYASFRMSSGITDPAAIVSGAGLLNTLIARMYPPALWFQNALSGTDPFGGVWLLLLFGAAVFLLMLWLGRNFVSINSRIKSLPSSEKFVMRRQVRASRITALFRKERSRYFSSSLYVVNTAFSYLMLLAAGVFALLKADVIESFFVEQEMGGFTRAIPFLLGWIVSMGTTTASAISMEGKSLWIVKSLPVPARDWLTAKLMVSLMLAVPSILVSSALVSIGLHASAAEWVWLYLTPLVYAAAFAVYGLWLNLRMPRLDWQNEAEVVKQGGAAMICVFTGMGAAYGPAILAGVTNSAVVLPVTLLALVLATALLWRSLVKSGERRLLLLR